MMFAKFFGAPIYDNGAWSTFQDRYLFAADEVVEYSYTKRWSGVGDFSLVLPYSDSLLTLLSINGVITYDGDWLFIQTIQYDRQRITLSGKDCKGLLDLRLTEYGGTSVSGAEGYDVVSGTTAVCVKHYLDANAISPATSARSLPLMWDTSSVSGLASDSYMARLEYLSEVVKKLCDGADIGYDVTGILSGSLFKFTLLHGTDRSFSQSANPRVIFSPSWGNVRSMSFEHSVDSLLNVIYAVDTNQVTNTIIRGSDTPSGVGRRESTVSVSVSSTDPATAGYFDKYAIAQAADNVEFHSYTIEPSVSGYGTDYSLGDIVTVLEPATNNKYNATITEITKAYSQGKRDITITLGDQKQKPLQRIVNDLISGTARRR